MGGIVQVCCGGKHPCRCVGPASALRSFNGALHLVYFLHDTKRPRVRLMTVPCLNSSYRSHHFYGRRMAPASRGGRPPVVYLISRSESYDVVYYRSLGVLVLVAFTVACGGLLLASVGMALTPNSYAPWCGLRGCLGWCVAIGCLALR